MAKVENYIEEKTYKTCVDLLPITTVDLLIFNEDLSETVLFKRENEPLRGMYYSIGGRVYKNENLLNSAIRICENEAGLKINKGDLIFGGVTEEIFHNSNFSDINAHNINIFYGLIAKKCELHVKCDEQHSSFRWFNTDDINIHPYLAQKIYTLLKSLSS